MVQSHRSFSRTHRRGQTSPAFPSPAGRGAGGPPPAGGCDGRHV